jgi:threonine/homoserine/homoserine lactone efflux protein
MPGSLLTYTIDKSIKSGKKAGFLISIGHSILELLIVIILLSGFGKYLSTDLAKIIIGFTGGIILCFLGMDAVRGAVANRLNISFKDESGSKYGNILVGGVVVSASNPYFIIWWATVGLGLIQSAYNSFAVAGVVIFYLGHILSDISWYGLISVLISKTRTFINMKVYRIVISVLGIFLFGFGFAFILNSIKVLI